MKCDSRRSLKTKHGLNKTTLDSFILILSLGVLSVKEINLRHDILEVIKLSAIASYLEL